MSFRTFTIRSVSGSKQNITVQPHETFEDVKRRIMEVLSIDPSKQLKLMHNSKIVDADMFSTLQDGAVLGCVTTKAPSSSTSSTSSTSTSTATVVQQTDALPSDGQPSDAQSSDAKPTDAEPMYRFKNIKAFTIVFLNFIATNPQLRNAFLNNFGLLTTELIKNEDLEALMLNILSQSDSILQSMEKGQNIKLNMNMSSKKMEKIDGQPDGVESIEITDQDSANIDQIIAMGFHPDRVVVEYLKNGKDINRTLDA